MNEPYIELRGVSFSYDKHAVLDNIDLTIRRGEFVAVLGYNGSGKSTLAKLMNGILLPNEGEVTVDSIPTTDESRLLDIRRRVGMVFQNPDNQIVATIVEEDVAFAPENMGVPQAEMRKRVDEALEIVGMSDYRFASPSKLSGGQKQRIAIAGVLAMQPEVIVLDEPTAMLDPSGRARVLQTIRELREKGITVVLITHYMEEAAAADRLIILSGGRIARDGDPKSIFGDPCGVRGLGLDVPQVTELCELLRTGGVSMPSDIIAVDECVEAIAERLGVGV